MYLPRIAERDWPKMPQLGPDFRKSYLEWSRNEPAWKDLYGREFALQFIPVDPGLFSSFARDQNRATDLGCLLDYAKAIGRRG